MTGPRAAPVPPAAPLTPSTRIAVVALALTQLMGWGSTFYLPAVLAVPLGRDLGLGRELVFGGITLMLIAGALISPRVGVIMDRRGLRGLLVLGSVVMAAALVTLALSTGWLGYALAWILVGLGMPLALTQGALAALARVAGPRARQAIATMFLMSGFSASVFWPLTAWLEAQFGWRATCLAFAGMHLLVCAPLHALATSRRLESLASSAGGSAAVEAGTLAPERRGAAFAWCALAFSAQGFVSWGLPLNLIEILKALDQPPAVAVGLAALLGPAQVVARFGEALFGPRFGILAIGLAASVAAPFAIALPLGLEASPVVAGFFVVGYGLSAGAFTIVRAVVPLALFGRERYATMIGRLALPQNIAFAAAPVAIAGALDRFGAAGALWLCLAAAFVALASFAALARVARD